jgi:predicted Zn-dependent protease
MIQQQLNFSREAEREADRVGFQTLVDAGFDGRGMEAFFGRLQAGSRIYESAAPAYLRTHPMTVERISDMQNRTRSLRFRQRADSLDFQLVRARLRVLQETTTQGWRDALDYFNGQIANRTTPTEFASRYGIAVAALKLNQPDLALQSMQAARKLAPGASVLLDKGVSEARFAAARDDAERDEAVKLAQENAARYPLSALAAHHYVDLLLRTNRHQDAIGYLRNQQAITRGQPAYYALLGRSYEALNRRSLHHQAVGEMYVLLGALGPAIQQFELSRRANDGDFYTMSEVDARLRDLRVQFKREQDALRESGRRAPDEGKSGR